MKSSTRAKRLIGTSFNDEEEYRARLKEKHKYDIEESCMFGSPMQDLEMYYPEDYGKAIPKEGAWIMVLDTHSFGKSDSDRKTSSLWVKALSFYYAKPVVKNFDSDWQVGQKLAQIITKQGEALLYPHEYNVVGDIYKYYESFGDGINIIWLNDKAEKEVGNPEALFYIRSRGISLKEAYKMILGEIKDQNLLYLESDDEIMEMFNKQVPPKEETELLTQNKNQDEKSSS